MKSRIVDFFVKTSYYPRLFLDYIISLFIKNDYSILDKFRNQECMIVGNGPSLNKTPLDKINMVSIGMNKINMIFDRTSWRPDIIVCVNGLVIRQNLDFFNTTDIPLVLPIKSLYLGIKKRPNIIFVRVADSLDFESDLRKHMGIGFTVTFACLQVAGFLNPKSVNIVGVDHYFKGNNTEKPHEIKVLEGDDLNHFDPNYFKDKLWGYPDLDGSEKAYLISKAYFDSKKIPITDYTVDGKLTIFERGEIQDLIKRSEPIFE